MIGFYSDNPEKDYDRHLDYQDEIERRNSIKESEEAQEAIKCISCNKWTDPDLIFEDMCEKCYAAEQE